MSTKGVLVWNDHVLLVHNERDEWELPGGQLEDGETPEECVSREILEELSIEATVSGLIDTWVYEVVPGTKVLIITFGCEADRPSDLWHSDEHDGVCLASVNALDELRMPDGYKRSIRHWIGRGPRS